MISPWTGHDITNASYDMVSLSFSMSFGHDLQALAGAIDVIADDVQVRDVTQDVMGWNWDIKNNQYDILVRLKTGPLSDE